jgi:hypothetical protein
LTCPIRKICTAISGTIEGLGGKTTYSLTGERKTLKTFLLEVGIPG